MEQLPCLWDLRSPTFNDMELVNAAFEKSRKEHQRIFKLPQMASLGEVQDLFEEMRANARDAQAAMYREFGANGGLEEVAMQEITHFLKVCAFLDKQCSYATAMVFTSGSDHYELELLDKLTSYKLIVDKKGEKSVRYSNGHIDHMKDVPLCLIKMKLYKELERYDEYMDLRDSQVKNRLGAWLFEREMQWAEYLFDTVLPMKE